MFKHNKMEAHLLSIHNLESLLHFATLCAPALLISDQRDVGMFGDTVITCAAVNTLSIIIITQIIIATTETPVRCVKINFTCTVYHISNASVFFFNMFGDWSMKS